MVTYETIDEELKSLRDQLATEQQSLADLTREYDRLCRATVDNPEAALEAAVLPSQREMINAKIRGLQIRIGEKEAMRAELEKPIVAAMERQRQEEAKAKWEAIRAQCRKARDEFDKLKAKLEAATKTVEATQEAFEVAQDELIRFRATPYDPVHFSPAELASARRRDAKLENAMREALARREDALTTQGGIRSELLQVSDELARLAWQENWYRPADMRQDAATPATLGEMLARR